MREYFSENCLNHLFQLAVGAGVVAASAGPIAAIAGPAAGLVAAIGAGQMAATGAAGLTAMAAGRAIHGRANDDVKSRAVCEAVQKQTARLWINSGDENA